MITCPFCEGRFDIAPERTPAQAQCPNCKEYAIVELPSMNKKTCFACHTEYDWHLKPMQKSVLIKGMVGGQENGSSHKNIETKK